MEHLELPQPQSLSHAKCVRQGEKITARSGLPNALHSRTETAWICLSKPSVWQLATWIIIRQVATYMSRDKINPYTRRLGILPDP